MMEASPQPQTLPFSYYLQVGFSILLSPTPCFNSKSGLGREQVDLDLAIPQPTLLFPSVHISLFGRGLLIFAPVSIRPHPSTPRHLSEPGVNVTSTHLVMNTDTGCWRKANGGMMVIFWHLRFC
jgi:hypothetical protein